jgi:phosphate/phosphite/phosphonate ABC transporter binding protein
VHWGILALGLALGAAPTGEPVRLGLIPAIAHERMEAEFTPVADFLAARIGRPVQLVVAKDYAEISSLLKTHSVEFAVLFPLAFAQAEGTIPDVTLIACSVRQGKPAYHGYIITTRNSPVHSLAELRGRRIGFVDRGSTSGYLFPVQVLIDEGLIKTPEDLPKFFSEVKFLKSHDNVLKAVLAGEVDAGAIYDGEVAQAGRLGVDPGQLRILARTAPIPHEAVVAAPGVPPQLKDAFRSALLGLDTRTPEGRAVLRPLVTELKLNGYVDCDRHVFDPVRRLMEKEP